MISFSVLTSMVVAAGSRQAPGPPSFNCTTQAKGAFDPIVLRNGDVEARFIRYGATLTHLIVPDKHGDPRDIALGWDDTTQYCANPTHTYFGATIGRIANRIANGTFDIDGKTYHTPLNDHGKESLHGGWVGYDRRVWTVVSQTQSSVKFGLTSPDGEMGFPGEIKLTVTHTLTDKNEWELAYSGSTDANTILAMTNHVYFNLNANIDNTATVLEHELSMATATKFVPVDSLLIPTGEVLDVKTAPQLDFTEGKKVGTDINKGTVTPTGGYDNAWVFADWKPGGAVLEDVVTLASPLTGITVTMSTDQPSVQFYSGNFLNATDPASRIQRKKSQSYGPDPQYYHWRGAATLEAQHFPDAVHHPNFPTTSLKPGDTYTQFTKYKFAAKK